MPEKTKFGVIMDWVFSIILGILCVYIFDYFYMKMAKEHLPVLVTFAAGGIATIVKYYTFTNQKEIKKLKDEISTKANESDLQTYRNADREVHEEMKSILEHIDKQYEEIMKRLNK
jgi:hypothetical protein